MADNVGASQADLPSDYWSLPAKTLLNALGSFVQGLSARAVEALLFALALGGAFAGTAAGDPLGVEAYDVLETAFCNAALETGIANTPDAAIVRAGTDSGLSVGGFTKTDEIPYDFNRKCLTIVIADTDPSWHRLVVKGAVNETVGICTPESISTGEVPLDDARKAQLLDYVRQQGESGFRVLALAARSVMVKIISGDNHPLRRDRPPAEGADRPRPPAKRACGRLHG